MGQRLVRLGFVLVAVALLDIAAPIDGQGDDAGPPLADRHITIRERSEVVGRSVEGRAIRARRLGDPAAERTVLVVGSIHGDETQGHRVIERLRRRYADRLGAVDMWTIATVNPDGVSHDTRKNAHGVDLNRNFAHDFDPGLSGGYESGPGPFSEPESRAVRDLARRIEPDLSIWYHQPWGVTLIPCNHTRDVALRYARLSGLRPRDCHAYPPGSATGWQYHRFGDPAFVVEFPGRRLRQSEVRRHARAVVKLASDR